MNIRLAAIAVAPLAVLALAALAAPARADDVPDPSAPTVTVDPEDAWDSPASAPEVDAAPNPLPAPRPTLTLKQVRRALLSHAEATRASGVHVYASSQASCDLFTADACERTFSTCPGIDNLLDVKLANAVDTSTPAWKRVGLDLRWDDGTVTGRKWKTYKESARMFAYGDYSYGFPTAGRMVVRLSDGSADLYAQASCWFHSPGAEMKAAYTCARRTAEAQLSAALRALR